MIQIDVSAHTSRGIRQEAVATAHAVLPLPPGGNTPFPHECLSQLILSPQAGRRQLHSIWMKQKRYRQSTNQRYTLEYNLRHASLLNSSHPQLNIFVAAQRGDVETIQSLIESGRAKATDRDDQNVTALHWAAINAQLPACRYLLEQGAEVDALGGDLVATPVQWAARNGYLYVIQLLIAHGADPTIADAQGYNALHLTTHSSAVMPLLYLLHQPISVDSRDAQGHTSLMWAAYQGDALSVDLLLKHGADPNTRDENQLTPLHWAVVKGNRNCIRKLVEKGADISAKNQDGKTPRDMAIELKSLGAWKRALEEGGMLEDGARKQKPLSEVRSVLRRASYLLMSCSSGTRNWQYS